MENNVKPVELMQKYFKVMDSDNKNLVEVIDTYYIIKNQYFPIYGFAKKNPELKSIKKLKKIQKHKIDFLINSSKYSKYPFKTVNEIIEARSVPKSYKAHTICYLIYKKILLLDDVEKFLRNFEEKNSTFYRQVLCFYDYIKYSEED